MEIEERTDDVEARLVEGANAGSSGLDLDEAELIERPQPLANGPPVDPELLNEFPLRGEAIPGAVTAPKDLVSEVAGDLWRFGHTKLVIPNLSLRVQPSALSQPSRRVRPGP
ncbi:unnamed protein product, partial [marine sediment metagenome]